MLAKVLQILTFQCVFLWVKALSTVRNQIKSHWSLVLVPIPIAWVMITKHVFVPLSFQKNNVENIKSTENNITSCFRKPEVCEEKDAFNVNYHNRGWDSWMASPTWWGGDRNLELFSLSPELITATKQLILLNDMFFLKFCTKDYITTMYPA